MSAAEQIRAARISEIRSWCDTTNEDWPQEMVVEEFFAAMCELLAALDALEADHAELQKWPSNSELVGEMLADLEVEGYDNHVDVLRKALAEAEYVAHKRGFEVHRVTARLALCVRECERLADEMSFRIDRVWLTRDEAKQIQNSMRKRAAFDADLAAAYALLDERMSSLRNASIE